MLTLPSQADHYTGASLRSSQIQKFRLHSFPDSQNDVVFISKVLRWKVKKTPPLRPTAKRLGSVESRRADRIMPRPNFSSALAFVKQGSCSYTAQFIPEQSAYCSVVGAGSRSLKMDTSKFLRAWSFISEANFVAKRNKSQRRATPQPDASPNQTLMTTHRCSSLVWVLLLTSCGSKERTRLVSKNR